MHTDDAADASSSTIVPQGEDEEEEEGGNYTDVLSKSQKRRIRKKDVKEGGAEAFVARKRPPPTPEEREAAHQEARAKRRKTYADAASKHLVLHVTFKEVEGQEPVSMTEDDLLDFYTEASEAAVSADFHVKVAMCALRDGRIRVAFEDAKSKAFMKDVIPKVANGKYKAWDEGELPRYKKAWFWLPLKKVPEPKKWLTQFRSVYSYALHHIDVRLWGIVPKEGQGSTMIVGLSEKALKKFEEDRNRIFVGLGGFDLRFEEAEEGGERAAGPSSAMELGEDTSSSSQVTGVGAQEG
jgi:hypothetical protein